MQFSDRELMLIDEMSAIANVFFMKDFLGIFHGALSAKINNNYYLINKRQAIFNHLDADSMIKISGKKDNRWSEASRDAAVHVSIYQSLSCAKYIAYCTPPFVCAYVLKHDRIIPQDYWGCRLFKEIVVHDPREFETWQDRSEVEVARFFKERKADMLIVRGYGVYLHARDLSSLSDKVAILENSCKTLYLSGGIDEGLQLW